MTAINLVKTPMTVFDKDGKQIKTNCRTVHLTLECEDDTKADMYMSCILKAIGDVLY